MLLVWSNSTLQRPRLGHYLTQNESGSHQDRVQVCKYSSRLPEGARRVSLQTFEEFKAQTPFFIHLWVVNHHQLQLLASALHYDHWWAKCSIACELSNHKGPRKVQGFCSVLHLKESMLASSNCVFFAYTALSEGCSNCQFLYLEQKSFTLALGFPQLSVTLTFPALSDLAQNSSRQNKRFARVSGVITMFRRLYFALIFLLPFWANRQLNPNLDFCME